MSDTTDPKNEGLQRYLAQLLGQANEQPNHARIHRAAEHFIAQYDEQPVNTVLPERVLRFSGCLAEALVGRLIDELAGYTLAEIHVIAMMLAFQLGWLAHEQHAAGSLALEQAGPEPEAG